MKSICWSHEKVHHLLPVLAVCDIFPSVSAILTVRVSCILLVFSTLLWLLLRKEKKKGICPYIMISVIQFIHFLKKKTVQNKLEYLSLFGKMSCQGLETGLSGRVHTLSQKQRPQVWSSEPRQLLLRVTEQERIWKQHKIENKYTICLMNVIPDKYLLT